MTIEQLRALSAAATEGPWSTRGCSHGGLILERPEAYPVQTVPAEDAALIAAARNHFDALLDVAQAAIELRAAEPLDDDDARLVTARALFDYTIARLEAL